MPKARPASRTRIKDEGSGRLYTLEVWVLEAPVPHQEVGKGESAARTIQILGSQTLHQLHEAIFTAFARKDPHVYEFQLGGEGSKPQRRFRPPVKDGKGEAPEETSKTTLDSLGLKAGQAFGYLFDFGDRWQHQIDVVAVDEAVPKGAYPRMIRKVGKSPPQYVKET